MSLTITEVRAAEGEVRAAEDRAAVRAKLVNVRELRNIKFDGELREKPSGTGGAVLEFEGYASVTEEPYEMYDWLGPYTEVVRRGAFNKTLSEGADVMFLVNHEGIGLARTKSGTMQLAEDDHGLLARATFDPASPIVQGVRSAMDRHDMDEMSMAFRTLRQQWSPDYEQRDILEVSLDKGDVSLVNYGANPATNGGLRSMELDGVNLRAFADGLLELRAGKALSASTMTTLQKVLDAVAAADTELDDAQVTLSDLMGVDNPDDPGEGEALGAGDDHETTSGMPAALAQRWAQALELIR